jgi:2'-5' RNA ligase
MFEQVRYPGSHRIFIAIMPDKHIRDEVRLIKRAFKAEQRNFDFIPMDQAHMTLQFLGNQVSGETLEAIITTLNEVRHSLTPTTINFNKLVFGFPGQRKPTVLKLETEKILILEQNTTAIHKSVQALELWEVNPAKDWGKLIHHMTLAKSKRGENKSMGRKINELVDTIKLPKLEMVFDKFYLVKSELIRTGTKYTPLAEFNFVK